MREPETHPVEMILRRCAEAAPEPWYPTAYAHETGTARESLDPYLDQLRLGGLIHLTDWVQGYGQGYALTPEGTQVLHSPRMLGRIKDGHLPVQVNGPAGVPARREGNAVSWERGEAARAAFMSPAPPVVTFSIIGLNLLWFLAGLAIAVHDRVPLNQFVFGSTTRILRLSGDMNGVDFYVHHQWWRLLTCAFVHIGLLHLGVNMLSLYWVGPLLETMWGHARFLVLYLIAAIGGSCGMLIDSPLVDTAGASGALWGVMASMGTWLFLNRNSLPRSLVTAWTRQLLIVLALNVAITYGIPGISKGGHFGGGIAGLVAAVPLDYLRFGSLGQRRLAALALVAIPVLSVGAVYRPFNDNARAQMAEQAQDWEIPELNEHYLPAVNRTTHEANTAYREQAKPLLEQHATRRQAAKVHATVAALADLRARLEQIAQDLAAAGPYRSRPALDAQQRGTEYVQAWATLLQMAEQDLSATEQSDDQERRLDGQERRVQEAREKWRALLR